ncbi:hypothetical protein CC2G_000820 [Coprinopsis cinerea AmutBmut pab1-1]|nr:hypothetical protein CC2G_000820 [Coprinopsis cinerea AmutBmut pab1-1]
MYAMRGEFCIGFASVLSLVSLLLLIFVHVSQINTSTVPRSIYMVHMNTSGYEPAIELATKNPFEIYATNASTPLDQGLGLYLDYYWGLYAHCGYLNGTEGQCSNHTLGHRYEPSTTILNDLSPALSILSRSLIPDDSSFTDAKYTGNSTKAAYWMILLGTVCAGLAFITGIPKHNYTFCVSTLFAVAGSILLLIGASIWTVVIKRTEAVNDLIVNAPTVIPVGIKVSAGKGLTLLWVSFAALTASVIPYMISCCTWRG